MVRFKNALRKNSYFGKEYRKGVAVAASKLHVAERRTGALRLN